VREHFKAGFGPPFSMRTPAADEAARTPVSRSQLSETVPDFFDLGLLANETLSEQLKNPYYSNNNCLDLFERETIMPNLDLSEQQTSLIRAVADTFQPTLRQQFLASVQDNLEGRSGRVTDADLMAAIESVRTTLTYSYDDFSDCC
jgi:hypothetical protein